MNRSEKKLEVHNSRGHIGVSATVTSARLVFRGRSKAKEKAASEGGKKSLVELFDEIV